MRFIMRPERRPVIIDSLPKKELADRCLHEQGGERRIPVITVIERWALCHHLGCVIKYLARSGKNPPLLKDLKTAEWYLERELTRPQQCSTGAIGTQSFTTEEVLGDWGLSFHLSEVLYHIKASKSPSLRQESLKHALKHLRAEIAQLSETNHPGGDAS